MAHVAPRRMLGLSRLSCEPAAACSAESSNFPPARILMEKCTKPYRLPRPPDVPLLRALWYLLDDLWGLLKGGWGVLVDDSEKGLWSIYHIGVLI